MTEKEFFDLYHKQIWKPNHLYANSQGRVYEYRLKVEKIIGRYLIPREIVHHHYNTDGSATLILCFNKIYHALLHTREEALRYCGHVNWQKCVFCKQYDDPKNLKNNLMGIYHSLCNRNK